MYTFWQRKCGAEGGSETSYHPVQTIGHRSVVFTLHKRIDSIPGRFSFERTLIFIWSFQGDLSIYRLRFRDDPLKDEYVVKKSWSFHHGDYDFRISSVTQSCLTPCEPMDCSMPGFPVHHQLLELAQIHAHQVSDAIQLSHPLSSPSPPAFNLSQHQGHFQWVSSSHSSMRF